VASRISFNDHEGMCLSNPYCIKLGLYSTLDVLTSAMKNKGAVKYRVFKFLGSSKNIGLDEFKLFVFYFEQKACCVKSEMESKSVLNTNTEL
jgi:hypothetical protein